MSIDVVVNGERAALDVPGSRRLLDVLREDLGLTGTKEGCGEGECGACSVLVDGAVVDSCLVPVAQVAGRSVRTVEGLAGPGGRLSVLQRAFLETGGAQCGICTPGMLIAGVAFLESGAAATDEAIREAIAGNLCRCTGYTKIVEAIALAAERGAGPDAGAGHEAGAGAEDAGADESAGPDDGAEPTYPPGSR
ncbi:MAG TPA: (2Fe-2S)-binding protein [Candidatus Limnocylindrales bacterium]|nr:(2Fe-2S)-binding protein [Candidatus Limnocylindrales bacterium]